jgi:hypothetical protein
VTALVLCAANDLGGLWAYDALVRARAAVQLVSTEVVTTALRWQHRVSSSETTFEIELADGRILRHDQVAFVLNRLLYLPLHHLALAEPSEREYATSELHGLFMSWLAAMPGRVWNPPSCYSLAGRNLHSSEWAMLAARVGLAAAVYRQSSEDLDDPGLRERPPADLDALSCVIVAGETLTGAQVPDRVGSACVELARLAALPLLGVYLRRCQSGWHVAWISPWPDLRRGGTPLIRALRERSRGLA